MLASSLHRSGKWPWSSQAFLAIAAVQAVMNIALEACLMAHFRQDPSYTRAQSLLYLVYGSGFVATQIAALLLTAAALRVRSAPLATAATAFDLLLAVLHTALLLQTIARRSAIAMQAGGIGVLVLGCAVKTWLLWQYLMKDFGWQVYRALGAGLRMQRIFFYRQLLLSLIILAAFFLFQFWLQLVAAAVLAGGPAGDWAESTSVIVVCAFTLCASLLAAVLELRWPMYGCIGVFAAAPAYFIYKLVAIVAGWPLAGTGADVHGASSRYMTVLLAMLLALAMALATVSLVVAWSFGNGLRQQLRHFQTLARRDIDLEPAACVEDDAHMPAADGSSSNGRQGNTGPSRYTVGEAFSRMLASTKGSLKESSTLFQAYFIGLDMPDECPTPEPTSTQPTLQLHHSIPKFSTTAFQDMFASSCTTTFQGSRDLSAAEESPRSSGSTDCISLPNDVAAIAELDMPRLGSCDSFVPATRPDTPVTLELLLSIEELNTINGELAVAASAASINRSRTHCGLMAASGSPAPSWSIVSSASFCTSFGTASNVAISPAHHILAGEKLRGVFQTGSYADVCSQQASVQSPLARRVANPDDISDCSEDERSALRASLGSCAETLDSVHTECVSVGDGDGDGSPTNTPSEGCRA